MSASAVEVVRRLKKAYPDVRITLLFSSPLELLVATILSAQCTDERVNRVTASLFKKYRSAADYAAAGQQALEQDIRSTGFYRNKAKNIIGTARMIQQRFNGQVPRTMEELLELPGVARKTANVVLGCAFGVTAGIVVDTHVKRLAERLGLSSQAQPEKIEADLMRQVPERDWIVFSFLLQRHGREVCVARKPRHSVCVLRDICPSRDI